MNIRKLKIFYKTAIALNMSSVAKELYISQPSVSQAIKEIEEELDVKLFERIGKKLYLTNEGELYLGYIRRILNLYEEANVKISNISNNKSGKIRIGASTTIGLYVLPSIIKKFLEENSELEVSLIIENTAVIEDLILENKIDFAFTEGVVHSKEIKKEVIWMDEIVFICGNKNKLSNEKIVSSNEIIKQKLILREAGSGTRENVEAYFNDHKIEYEIFMELRENEAVKKYVEAEVGIGCVSALCIDNSEEKTHSFILDKGKIERDLYFIIHKDKFVNKNIEKFMKFAYRQMPILKW